MVVGPDLGALRVNRTFTASYQVEGDRPAERFELGGVLGCPYRDAVSGACNAVDECRVCRLVAMVRDVLAGETVYRARVELDVEREGRRQPRVLLVSASPIVHEDEAVAIVVLEDVTEITGLRRLVGGESSFAGIVGRHPSMLEVFDTIRDVADMAVPVMILGESGTGKELVARAVHTSGSRQRGNFVGENCAALPESLLVSELFGHVKGAFTGATRDRKGRFELADGGTIFLDEIGDLSPQMQVKLLRVLQEGSFERVGGERTVTVDARVVCATNRDLEEAIRAGRFREDLFYRLCVVPIRTPPLRDRLSDLPLLAEHILEALSVTGSRPRLELSSEVLDVFAQHAWPGNVRELQNVLQYAAVKCKGGPVQPAHLPPSMRRGERVPAAKTGRRSQRMTTLSVQRALEESDGNRTRAAKALGVSRATLYRFLAEHPEVGEG